MVAVMKVPKPMYANQWKRMDIADIEVVYDGRRGYFSLNVDYKVDEDGSVIVGTVRYDGKPISKIPVIVDLIEQALQSDQV